MNTTTNTVTPSQTFVKGFTLMLEDLPGVEEKILNVYKGKSVYSIIILQHECEGMRNTFSMDIEPATYETI